MELRNDDNFDTFFSYNIFGRRGRNFPSFISQVVPKLLSADKVTVTVKTLPAEGRPPHFNGAVGRYGIEGALDKEETHAGDAVTYRVRVFGEGNINTVQTPAFPKLEDFKIYDSSSSTHISKENKKVEGEKVTETVIVPKKAGVFTIPALSFAYFDPEDKTYKGIKTTPRILSVKPSEVADSAALPDLSEPSSPEEAESGDLAVLSRDIRYIKTADDGKRVATGLLWNPFIWPLNLFFLVAAAFLTAMSARKTDEAREKNLFRMRRSYGVARGRLKTAASLMAKGDGEAFYAEISKAVYGYFGDKLGVPPQSVSAGLVEERAGDRADPRRISDVKALFNELALRRFGKETVEESREMRNIHSIASHVIASFEKAGFK
ncbi:MAG: BatD family protein [Candidatus Omnitrophica bacterium]|nr:BatD family protein [Candidatus Omnitrophota bacterium]